MTENEYLSRSCMAPVDSFDDACNFLQQWFVAPKPWRNDHVKDGKVKMWSRMMMDHRLDFQRIFGDPHFYYNGDEYRHCWDIVFNDGRFVVLASERNTSYEQVGVCDSKTRMAFMQWVYDKLQGEQP